MEAPLSALRLHPTIEALLLDAGCRTVRDVLCLPMAKLMDCGISLKELREIVAEVEASPEEMSAKETSSEGTSQEKKR